MAQVLIGAGADELVAGGDADFTAPVGAEVAARPDGEEDAGDFDDEAQGFEDGSCGEKAAGEARDGKDEEQDAEVEDDEVEAAGPGRFGGLGGCGVFGGGVPVDGEEADERDGGEHGGRNLEEGVRDLPAGGGGGAAGDAADRGRDEHSEGGF